MKNQPLLTAALLVVSAAGLLALNTCEPDCYDHVAGDLVEDPRNCTQYYICVYEGQPSDHTLVCPSGNIFDPTVGQCVPGTECVPSCPQAVCHLTCNNTLDLLQDLQDCSAYYICDEELNPVGPYYCPPEKPYFDGEYCVLDPINCCKLRCETYCYPGDVFIMDPMDCTKFYVCTMEGTVYREEYHYTCPEGKTFQPLTSSCKKDAPCRTLCS